MAGEQQLLGGRYLLRDKVGNGGMATVYRAQDEVLDRTVAVKIMLPQYASDATFAARFKQEAQAAAGLSSPYIVGIYDWGRDNDTYYIVMEYLRGTDLKSGIRSHGALDPKKVAQIGSQICGALSVAHKHEIIHRDIKPQNIMVLPDGNIKVMDFGIARAKNSHLTQDNNVLGTAHYVSPEQTRGLELGPTTDIYSLGVVMYECATGQVPFDGDDAISVALKQVNELPVPPSQLNPRVDATLERIILKCMEKDPADRFQTADELRLVLNNYLAGRTVEVAEPTRVISGVGVGAAGGEATRTMVNPVNAANTVAAGATKPRSQAGRYAEDEDEKKGGAGKIVAAVVAVVAAVAIAAFVVFGLFGSSTVTVPDVLGMTQEEAEAALEEAGLTVGEIEQSYSDEVEEGCVMEQTPDADKEVAEESEVDLVISKGATPAETVEMIDVTGMTESKAKAAIVALGLVASVTEEADDADEGTVFYQSVDEGEEVEVGSTVEIKVSTGPETATVPGVLGMTTSEASNALSNAGFEVKTETGDYSDTYAKGTVMAQSVTGTAAVGTTVTITISLGPEPTAEVSVPSVTGMTESEACSAIAEAGLRYNVTYASSSSVTAGCVISYSPSGTQEEGTTITIVVSTGPEAEDEADDSADETESDSETDSETAADAAE